MNQRILPSYIIPYTIPYRLHLTDSSPHRTHYLSYPVPFLTLSPLCSMVFMWWRIHLNIFNFHLLSIDYIDIDECQFVTDCLRLHGNLCVNLNGSFECDCRAPGFQKSFSGQECLGDNNTILMQDNSCF